MSCRRRRGACWCCWTDGSRRRPSARAWPESSSASPAARCASALGWRDTQLRVHLGRLVALEYLLVHQGSRGRSYVYELVYDPEEARAGRHLPGLIDVGRSRKRPATTTTRGVRRPTTRPPRAPVAGRSRGAAERGRKSFDRGTSPPSRGPAAKCTSRGSALGASYRSPAGPSPRRRRGTADAALAGAGADRGSERSAQLRGADRPVPRMARRPQLLPAGPGLVRVGAAQLRPLGGRARHEPAGRGDPGRGRALSALALPLPQSDGRPLAIGTSAAACRTSRASFSG